MKEQKYNAYLKEIGKFIPKDPKIVIRTKDENEVSRLLALADKYTLPVTFRAAGTSLSGQSISDSILIVAGKNWEKYSISEDFERITLQPGIIGARVNEILKPHGRKFAPDPASVKSAMVGGIVMNNASGMNCGTHANSDNRACRRYSVEHRRPGKSNDIREKPHPVPEQNHRDKRRNTKRQRTE